MSRRPICFLLASGGVWFPGEWLHLGRREHSVRSMKIPVLLFAAAEGALQDRKFCFSVQPLQQEQQSLVRRSLYS